MKRLLSFSLIFCMMLALSTVTLATSKPVTFEDYISDFYTTLTDHYTFWDKDGKDITDEFYAKTIDEFINGNIDFIYDQYLTEVYCGEKIHPGILRNGNVAKTQTWSVYEQNVLSTYSLLGTPHYANIEFIAYATIYYDQNTGLISDYIAYFTNGPRTTASYNYFSWPVSLASNSLSATFRMKVSYAQYEPNMGVILAEWLFSKNLTIYSDN